MIDYYLLTKPGIILGNLFTFAAGFLLASRGHLNLGLFTITLLGLGFIIASACVFNNYIDRHEDRKMERTKNRALASGTIKDRNALIFGLLLAVAGTFTLLTFTNPLTLGVTLVGFFVYVFLYSFLKKKTVYSTLIGSIAGAVPPVVGYCAVSNQLDAAAWILFALMIFWQMPHFFAISLWHMDDYAKAGIPLMPIVRGIERTKVHMVLYIIGLIPITALLTWHHYTGPIFLAAVTSLGLGWLVYSLKGFNADCDKHWGRQMFRISLAMISAICLIIPFDC